VPASIASIALEILLAVSITILQSWRMERRRM
jgi:hypothetical protein